MAGLKAGFAELGPIISQAFAPIAILTTFISGVKALVLMLLLKPMSK
jgi:hypothetical protein